MLRLLILIDRFGWKILVSFVFPVYWTQDFNFKNKGYDILTIFKHPSTYNRATYWNH
jgi:hypothetical protein